jgi:dynein heavy chain
LLTSWLKDLEDFLESMITPHNNFRLWLTTELTPLFPPGILRKSLRVVIEAPSDMKATMISLISKTDKNVPRESLHPKYNCIVFGLIFFHAVLQERRKYGKLDWNGNCDIKDSDFYISRKLLATYLTKAWEENEAVPWESLKYLLRGALYGSRVSDDIDGHTLSTYVEKYMGEFHFDSNFSFYSSEGGFDYCIPNRSTKKRIS